MDNNFESIKKFVACKSCQYYENEKCVNKDDCFWLDLEKKLKALEIIKSHTERFYTTIKEFGEQVYVVVLNVGLDNIKLYLTKEEYDLLKEVLL